MGKTSRSLFIGDLLILGDIPRGVVLISKWVSCNIFGNSLNKIKNIEGEINYCVTSPPYHNILRNKGNGIRDIKDKFRKEKVGHERN